MSIIAVLSLSANCTSYSQAISSGEKTDDTQKMFAVNHMNYDTGIRYFDRSPLPFYSTASEALDWIRNASFNFTIPCNNQQYKIHITDSEQDGRRLSSARERKKSNQPVKLTINDIPVSSYRIGDDRKFSIEPVLEGLVGASLSSYVCRDRRVLAYLHLKRIIVDTENNREIAISNENAIISFAFEENENIDVIISMIENEASLVNKYRTRLNKDINTKDCPVFIWPCSDELLQKLE